MSPTMTLAELLAAYNLAKVGRNSTATLGTNCAANAPCPNAPIPAQNSMRSQLLSHVHCG